MANLNVRMSNEEYLKIVEDAERMGMSVSDYIRFITKNVKISVELKKGDTVINKHTGKIYKVIQVRKEDNIIIGQNEHEKRAFGEELTYNVNDLEIVKSDK